MTVIWGELCREYYLWWLKHDTQLPVRTSIVHHFLRQSLGHLTTRNEKWLFILSNTVFILFFINTYLPFSMEDWEVNKRWDLMLSLSGYGMLAGIGLIITQFGFRALLKIKSFTIGSYLLWLVFELSFITVIIYLVYGERNHPNQLLEFWISLKYTSATALLSYSTCFVIITLIKQSRQLKSTPENTSGVHSAENKIKLLHENGRLALIVDAQNILFLKSADNYVEVVYLKKGHVTKELIRNNLKWFESNLSSSQFLRIHRSYMINMNRIDTVERNRSKWEIIIHHQNLPVSKSFKESFEKNYIEKTGH